MECKNCQYPYAVYNHCPNCGTTTPKIGKGGTAGILGLIGIAWLVKTLIPARRKLVELQMKPYRWLHSRLFSKKS